MPILTGSLNIGAPRRNLEAWRAFAGDIAVEVEGSAFAVLARA
jgi:hypothetical protein